MLITQSKARQTSKDETWRDKNAADAWEKTEQVWCFLFAWKGMFPNYLTFSHLTTLIPSWQRKWDTSR